MALAGAALGGGMAYNRDLCRRLLDEAERWRPRLSYQGRKQLDALAKAKSWFSDKYLLDYQPRYALGYGNSYANILCNYLTEVERLAKRGWLAGEGEAERCAILALHRGILQDEDLHHEALRWYVEAERGLPEGGQKLKRQLGGVLAALANELVGLKEQNHGTETYLAEAERLLIKVVAWLPEEEDGWKLLLEVLLLGGKYENAILPCQQAMALNKDNYLYPEYMGIGYYLLGRYEESIAAYKRAIELNAAAHSSCLGLGDVYRKLGWYDEAVATYKRLLELDPYDLDSQVSLAGVYRKLGQEEEYLYHAQLARATSGHQFTLTQSRIEAVCGNKEESLTLLEQAIAEGTFYRDLARRDPDFDFIRDDPRFRALVGEEDAPGK